MPGQCLTRSTCNNLSLLRGNHHIPQLHHIHHPPLIHHHHSSRTSHHPQSYPHLKTSLLLCLLHTQFNLVHALVDGVPNSITLLVHSRCTTILLHQLSNTEKIRSTLPSPLAYDQSPASHHIVSAQWYCLKKILFAQKITTKCLRLLLGLIHNLDMNLGLKSSTHTRRQMHIRPFTTGEVGERRA